MRVCINYGLISPHCPLLEPIHQHFTHWTGLSSTPSKDNPFLQACVCFTAPAQVLCRGWEAAKGACRTETRSSHAASSEGSSYPPLAETLADSWLRQLACMGESHPLSQPLFASWVGKQVMAAVHGVGKKRDGDTVGSSLARQHGPNHNPAPSTCPWIGAEHAAHYCAACGGCPALLRQMRGSSFSRGVIQFTWCLCCIIWE